MGARRSSGERGERERDLTERQRYWLKHLRTAEKRGEPVKAYATRLGLSKSSLYEAARRLRIAGVIDASPNPARSAKRRGATRKPEFVEIKAAEPAPSPSAAWRARLPNGVVLEGSGDVGAVAAALARF